MDLNEIDRDFAKSFIKTSIDYIKAIAITSGEINNFTQLETYVDNEIKKLISELSSEVNKNQYYIEYYYKIFYHYYFKTLLNTGGRIWLLNNG